MEIDRELGPPSASTIVSTEASIVAAITLTTSNRIPSRVQEARTDPVLRRKRTASRPPSGSIAERNEREAFSNPDVDLRLRLSPPLPYAVPIDVSLHILSPDLCDCAVNASRTTTLS